MLVARLTVECHKFLNGLFLQTYYPWAFAYYARTQFSVPCRQNINLCQYRLSQITFSKSKQNLQISNYQYCRKSINSYPWRDKTNFTHLRSRFFPPKVKRCKYVWLQRRITTAKKTYIFNFHSQIQVQYCTDCLSLIAVVFLGYKSNLKTPH